MFWCRDAKKALAFPKNSFSFSNSRTRRRRAVISASISRGSGHPCWAAWRRSRSSLTHRPTTDSPSPTSRATDAIVDPVSNTRHATSRRYSGVKRRREPITGTSLSAGTRTRFTKCQQHQPKPSLRLLGNGVIPQRHPHGHGTCTLAARSSSLIATPSTRAWDMYARSDSVSKAAASRGREGACAQTHEATVTSAKIGKAILSHRAKVPMT